MYLTGSAGGLSVILKGEGEVRLGASDPHSLIKRLDQRSPAGWWWRQWSSPLQQLSTVGVPLEIPGDKPGDTPTGRTMDEKSC